MFPLYLLHAVRVVGHVLADPHLAQRVPVASVGSFEVLHQIHQCPQLQGLEHEVVPPADPQRPKASPAVDPQHNVMEVVPWELRLEADGETLHARHAVGEVTE